MLHVLQNAGVWVRSMQVRNVTKAGGAEIKTNFSVRPWVYAALALDLPTAQIKRARNNATEQAAIQAEYNLKKHLPKP